MGRGRSGPPWESPRCSRACVVGAGSARRGGVGDGREPGRRRRRISASFEKRLTVHTLPNGYTFLILERPGRPCSRSPRASTSGRRRRSPASPAWRTCSSTWRSRARRGSARRTSRRRRSRSTNSRRPTRPTSAARAAVKPDPAEVDRLLKAFKEKEAAAQEFVVANAFDEAPVARGRRRPERRHQRRGDHLLLLAADQQVRAVRLPRVGALPAPRVPRVLQGTRRGDGGAPAAHREPADWQAHRADARHGLPGAPVQAADRRLHERPAALHDERRRSVLPRSITCPRTWSRPSSAT